VRIEHALHQQFGLITRAQALAYGMKPHQVDYRVKKGRWVVEHPGVYRAVEVRPTWESNLLAAVLRSGGAASHRAAATLWGLDVYDKPPPEITVPEGHSVRIDVVPLSDFSRRVVQLLERANIASPVVEYRITDGNGHHILQVDLAWPDKKKAWELDGLEWHFGRNDIERDRRKRNAVVGEGWTIQEVLWSMYVDDPAGLVRMAKKFLH